MVLTLRAAIVRIHALLPSGRRTRPSPEHELASTPMANQSEDWPCVFVGSSTEGLNVARAIQFQLKDNARVSIWNDGVFGLSHGSLEALVRSLDRFDFAVLVITPDDVVLSRTVESQAPRDNVMFELGLFMGHLGRDRTFGICGDSPDMKLPSDLAGVSLARYDVAHLRATISRPQLGLLASRFVKRSAAWADCCQRARRTTKSGRRITKSKWISQGLLPRCTVNTPTACTSGGSWRHCTLHFVNAINARLWMSLYDPRQYISTSVLRSRRFVTS